MEITGIKFPDSREKEFIVTDMKSYPPLLTWLLLLLIGAVAGFTAGYFTGYANSNESAERPLALASGVKAITPPQRTVTTTDQPTVTDIPRGPSPPSPLDVYRVPRVTLDSLLTHYYSYDHLPGESIAEIFGVPEKEAAAIQHSISRAVDRMHTLEADHSKMERERDGDLKFMIAAFPREAAEVRENLRDAIRSQLAGFDDERAELLGDAVMQHKVFRLTGEQESSLAGRKVTNEDGHTAWKPLAMIGRNVGNGIHAMMEEPVNFDYDTARLNRLMTKHQVN
jgi:hypothetical protein